MFSYLNCVIILLSYILESLRFKSKSTLIWRSQEEPWQRWWGRNMASLIRWVVSLYPMVSHLDGQLLALAKFCGVVMQKLPLVSDCTVVLIEVGRSPSGFLSWVMMGFWRFVIFWLKPIFDISSLPSGWNSPKKREKRLTWKACSQIFGAIPFSCIWCDGDGAELRPSWLTPIPWSESVALCIKSPSCLQ